MTPRTGRPTNDPKRKVFQIRLSENTAQMLQNCADELQVSKAAVVEKGIKLVDSAIKENK